MTGSVFATPAYGHKLRQRADVVVYALEQIVKDRSITAANRRLALQALQDAREIRDRASSCPGCDEYGSNVRQKPNGDLVCMVCDRTTTITEPASNGG